MTETARAYAPSGLIKTITLSTSQGDRTPSRWKPVATSRDQASSYSIPSARNLSIQ
jgi:hypothetical protein